MTAFWWQQNYRQPKAFAGSQFSKPVPVRNNNKSIGRWTQWMHMADNCGVTTRDRQGKGE